MGGVLLAPGLDELLSTTGEGSTGTVVTAVVEGPAPASAVTPVLTATSTPVPAPTPTPIPPLTMAHVDAEHRLVAGVYERVAPSVVHIHVVQHVTGSEVPQIEIPQIPGWPDFGLPQAPRVVPRLRPMAR